MNVADLIARKRDGQALSPDEIGELIRGYVDGSIPDYQMAAWAMAVYFRGMSGEETAALTRQMLHSGETLRWPAGSPPRVDKHSTGGVGDKVSLVLVPLLACCGLLVPMISGRGLGPTGGTLDKLESIPGVRTDLSRAEIQQVTERVGCVITGTTADLAPADGKLYALRDVTATVPSIPLITASILSKKLAEGLDALVLDVKFGSGAFMKSAEAARTLACSLVGVARQMRVQATALLTDMNQPLGRMVGNAVEVNETVDALCGHGPGDLMEITLALGSELLLATGRAADAPAARAQLLGHVDSGRGLAKLAAMVDAQGGNLDAPRMVAPSTELLASRSGVVGKIDAEQLGRAVIELGGGRRALGDAVDRSVGLEMLVRIGDTVESGQPLLRVFATRERFECVRRRLEQAIHIGEEPPGDRPLVAERITAENAEEPIVNVSC